MMGRLLSRGMFAGIFAALVAFLFARIFGESQVNLSIAYEAHQAALAHEPAEPELVSRAVQAGWGLLTAIVMYGAAYGGLFAVLFGCAYGRVSRLPARQMALWLAIACFVVAVLVPDLKYPPNPPAVGLPETINLRTVSYFTMLGLSFCSAIIGLLVARQTRGLLGNWNANFLGIAVFLVLTCVLSSFLPDISEVPSTFPASVLWRFREASIGMQLILWTTLGVVFGPMSERALEAPMRRL
ncbi:CbtA family protein [Acetobacter sp.]|uniref:CbtA family protein n=1 Tax=Acetobacter sp. TaxID=440 RepID=UPI0039E8C62D